ncbi:hypothetical protein D3C85_213970 [compost metagenome]
MAHSRPSGVSFSSSTVAAPKRRGNSSRPPRPKVNASGGVPMKMSPARTCNMERGKQSQMANKSRCMCMVPLGMPVVPEVKLIRQTSSAAVSCAANGASWAAMRRSSSVSTAPKHSMAGKPGTPSSSARKPCAHSTAFTSALARMVDSSRARSSGMVGTAMQPAFSTASRQAAIMGVFAPRSSTRLPGIRRKSLRNTWAMRSTCCASSA